MLRVVLHPEAPSGLREGLEARDDVRLCVPGCADGVADALNQGAEVLIAGAWEDRFLQPSLRWVAGLGAGYEQYPLRELEAAGVVLTTARGVHTSAVSEHAFGLLLALTRRIAYSVRQAASRRWEPQPAADLAGASVVVVGLGTIGERIAQLCQAFGMRVTGVKRDPASYDGCADAVIPWAELVDGLVGADVLFSVLPGGPATRRCIGAEELAALGHGWFINVGRGSVVDERALIHALTAGELRGAGLDVFEEEPLPVASPLWGLDNVVITPHIGGDGPNYVRNWSRLFADNLRAMHGDGPWRNRLVDGRVV